MARTLQLGRSSQPSVTFYHVHLLTHQEAFLLGEVLGDQIQLNPAGQIAADEWRQITTAHQRDIELDHWTVLPDGVRALIAIVNGDTQPSATYGRQQSLPKPRALSSCVAGFKAAAAKRINLIRGVPGAPVWQRGYQEQRIDDSKTLDRIRQLLTSQAQAAGLVANGITQKTN